MQTNPDDGVFDACAHCGRSFLPDVRYPVRTEYGAGEELELYSFCDETCVDAWLSSGAAGDDD